jgi:hypothetical protein
VTRLAASLLSDPRPRGDPPVLARRRTRCPPIPQHGDVVVSLDDRGTQGDQAAHLLAHARGRAEVEVDPVGCRPRPTTAPEPDVRPAPARRLDVGAFSGGFLIHVGGESRGPEPGDAKGVLAVERQVLDERWAWSSRCRSARRRWDSNPRGPRGPGDFQGRCLRPLGHSSPGESRGVAARGGDRIFLDSPGGCASRRGGAAALRPPDPPPIRSVVPHAGRWGGGAASAGIPLLCRGDQLAAEV